MSFSRMQDILKSLPEWPILQSIHNLVRSNTFEPIQSAEVTLSDCSNAVLQLLFYVFTITRYAEYLTAESTSPWQHTLTATTDCLIADTAHNRRFNNCSTTCPGDFPGASFYCDYWNSIECYLSSSTTCSQVMIMYQQARFCAFRFHITWYLSRTSHTKCHSQTPDTGICSESTRRRKSVMALHGAIQLPKRLLHLRSYDCTILSIR